MGAGVLVKGLLDLVIKLLPLLLTWMSAKKSAEAKVEQERSRVMKEQRDATKDRPSGARDTIDLL